MKTRSEIPLCVGNNPEAGNARRASETIRSVPTAATPTAVKNIMPLRRHGY